MFFRSKKLGAFITGCLATTVIFGYPSQLLAQTNTLTDPIQGVTSTTQETPTTATEFNDVITGLAAGVNIGDLIEPGPEPTREYIAFLNDIWSDLFSTEYNINESIITTGEWIHGAEGNTTAQNEHGESLSIDITLSLELLPDHYSFIDQNDIDLLTSASVRLGIAWTTLTNTANSPTPTLIFWMQSLDNNIPTTIIFPLARSSEEEIDLYKEVVYLMEGSLDDPEYYNFENDDTLGLFDSFRTKVRSSIRGTMKNIALAVVVGAAAIIVAPVLAAGAAVAIGVIAATAAIEMAAAYDEIKDARDQLRTDLANRGWNVDDATWDEIIIAAKIEDLLTKLH